MPLAAVTTKPVLYKGCPPGCSHAVFVKPNGMEVAALLRVDASWTVSLFVEEEFHRFFLVASSPDGEELLIERWLHGHAPTRVAATTQAEQAAALGGKHVGNATPAELADAAAAQLTASDAPLAVPPPQISISPLTAPNPDAPNPRVKRGEYVFLQMGETPTLRCLASGLLQEHSVKTKGLESEILAAFKHADLREAYFLFDKGTDYLLESLRFWGGKYERREATGTQASLPGNPQQVVEAMIPSLVSDNA
jgi:hypothetical protein